MAGTQLLLRDQTIYVFTFARVEKAPDAFDECVAKHPEHVEAGALGEDILKALRSYGRLAVYEDIKARPDPILKATGYKSAAKLNKGLGSVSVSFFANKNLYDLVPWRNKGRQSFGATEERQQLPASASAEAIGEQALKLLRWSREINSDL